MQYQEGDSVTINASYDTYDQQCGVIHDEVPDLTAEVGEPIFRVEVGDREFLYAASQLKPSQTTQSLNCARVICATNRHPYRPYANALLQQRQFRTAVTKLGWSTRPRLVASKLAKIQGVRPRRRAANAHICWDGQ